jgi:hypothetical protein
VVCAPKPKSWKSGQFLLQNAVAQTNSCAIGFRHRVELKIQCFKPFHGASDSVPASLTYGLPGFSVPLIPRPQIQARAQRRPNHAPAQPQYALALRLPAHDRQLTPAFGRSGVTVGGGENKFALLGCSETVLGRNNPLAIMPVALTTQIAQVMLDRRSPTSSRNLTEVFLFAAIQQLCCRILPQFLLQLPIGDKIRFG